MHNNIFTYNTPHSSVMVRDKGAVCLKLSKCDDAFLAFFPHLSYSLVFFRSSSISWIYFRMGKTSIKKKMYAERMLANRSKRIRKEEEETAAENPSQLREQTTAADDTATTATSADLPIPLPSTSGSQDVTAVEGNLSFTSSFSLRKKLYEGKLEQTVCDDDDNVNISVKVSDMRFIINSIVCSVCGDEIQLKVKYVCADSILSGICKCGNEEFTVKPFWFH